MAGLPFFLRSGFPFFTVAKTRSPAPAAGRRFNRPLIPFTAMMYRFLAPVLSAQFMTAPTGRPRDILNFAPDAPFFPENAQNYLNPYTFVPLYNTGSSLSNCSMRWRQIKLQYSFLLTSLRHIDLVDGKLMSMRRTSIRTRGNLIRVEYCDRQW